MNIKNNTRKKIGVAIVGGTGYGAGEILRILSYHNEVSVVSAVSASNAGALISDYHSHLSGFYDGRFTSDVDFTELNKYEHKVIFLSLPHGASSTELLKLMPVIERENIKVIDLSGDFRLTHQTTHEQHYSSSPFLPDLRSRFVYGLTETNRKAIRDARFIANPGCLATACILCAAPVLASGFTDERDNRPKIERSLIFDAKTGTSGAGRSVQQITHHPHRASNFNAYKVLCHRHEPEIVQGLSMVADHSVNTFFVPHLLPVSRGIFVTMYVTLDSDLTASALEETYRHFYRDSSFVRMRENSPILSDIVGTNFVDISLVSRGRQVVVMGALDNLVKGMAGQAIQNMNIMCSLSETTGLLAPSLGPG